jgi:hypothetical protein
MAPLWKAFNASGGRAQAKVNHIYKAPGRDRPLRWGGALCSRILFLAWLQPLGASLISRLWQSRNSSGHG